MNSNQCRAGARAALMLMSCALLACSDSPPSLASDGGIASACEHHDALSRKLGCAPIGAECALPAVCDALGNTWLDCVERDLRQCYCEGAQAGGDLNCEGSFKPDEGPARCRAEYERFEGCLDEHGSDDEQ